MTPGEHVAEAEKLAEALDAGRVLSFPGPLTVNQVLRLADLHLRLAGAIAEHCGPEAGQR